MQDLTELVDLRNRICQRLQVSLQDAEVQWQLLPRCGSRVAVAHQVTERVCYLVAILAMNNLPGMLLDEDPRCRTTTEGILEELAVVFADEIASLRRLTHRACRQVHGRVNVQALTAHLVDTFIVGESDW